MEKLSLFIILIYPDPYATYKAGSSRSLISITRFLAQQLQSVGAFVLRHIIQVLICSVAWSKIE